MHYSVLVFWFAVGGLVVSVLGFTALDDKPLFGVGSTIAREQCTNPPQGWEAKEWVLSLMIALVGILGSILMTKAVCWVTPSKVMVVRSFEVVAAYVLQVPGCSPWTIHTFI